MWDEAQLFVILGSVVCRLWMAACPATGIYVCALEMKSCSARFSLLFSLSLSFFFSHYIVLLLIESSASRGCKLGSGGGEWGGEERATAYKGESNVDGGTRAKREVREGLMK